MATFQNRLNALKAYFQPQENVRFRDVAREVPRATGKVLGEGMARLGVSAVEAPRILGQALMKRPIQASGRTYNTPFGSFNSFQSEAQNRVQSGESPASAIAKTGAQTIASGLPAGILGRGVVKGGRELTRFGKDLRAIENNIRNKRVIPGIVDSLPQRTFKTGERYSKTGVFGKPPTGERFIAPKQQHQGYDYEDVFIKGNGYQTPRNYYTRAYGKDLPSQTIRRTPDQTVIDPIDPQSKLLQFLMKTR